MKKIFTLATFILIGNVFAQVSPQTFTNPGNYTFTVPGGVNTLTIELVGAGGQGGSNGTGGGGGGGYSKGAYAVTPGATLAVRVGSPGAGPAIGTSSVGAFLQATGGDNGVSVPNPGVGGGGAGGVGSGGTITNRNGGNGGGGYFTYFGGGGGGAGGPASNGFAGVNTPTYNGTNCLYAGGAGGPSGLPPGGSGGKGAGFTNSLCSVTDPAANGGAYGGGGGGGNGIASPFGTGGGGYVQITFTGGCVPPPTPTNATSVMNATMCNSGTRTLSANGSGTLTWYSSPSSTTALGTGTTFITPTLTNNTTYYVEAFTCAASASRIAVSVTVYPNPTISAVPDRTLICAGETATLTASGAVNYNWLPIASGATISVSPTITTTYTINGSTLPGCTGSNTLTLNVSPCTGITEGELNNLGFDIYPNPFTNKLTLVNSSEVETHIWIYDILGSLVYKNKISEKTEINLSKQVPGIYFIRLENDKGTLTKKIIKE